MWQGCISPLHETKTKYRLTVVAALVGGAPGVVTFDAVSAIRGSVVVGARVGRAECLATLLFLALAVVALHVMGVFDQRVSLRAADGAAVRVFYVVVGLVYMVTRCTGNELKRFWRMG